ncbi:MAG: SGNH/GDSL hydrolase family protein [Humibacter sp.]
MRVRPVILLSAVGLVVTAGIWVRLLLTARTRASAVLNETLPVHSAWWRARAKEQGELLYVALGDSSAQGIGATVPDDGYVGILLRRIPQRSGRSVRTVNLSVSGSTTTDAVGYQLPRLKKLQPDIVTLAIGVNDLAAWNERAFAAGITEILEALPAGAIVADLPYLYLPRSERRVAVANRLIRRLADARGLHVAPLHAVTKRAGLLGIFTLFAGDRFHPNDAGYTLWASAFAPLVDARVDELIAAEHPIERAGI